MAIVKDRQFYKFAAYGFLKNLRFFDPFMILFFRQLGFSFLEIGWLFSVREISTNIMEIPTGIIADLFGRRLSMVLSMIAYMASFLVFFFFPNFGVYVVAMLLFSVGEAFRTGTHKALILEYLRIKGLTDRKTEYYGATRASSQLGSALNSVIAAALVFFTGDYRIIFIFSIIPYAINLINLYTYPKELDGDEKNAKKSETIKDFISIFKDKKVLNYLFSASIFSGFFKNTKNYVQPVLKYLALTIPLSIIADEQKKVSLIVGAVYFFFYLATALASKKSSEIQSMFGEKRVAINISFILGIISMILCGMFINGGFMLVAVLMLFVLFVLENLRRPMMVSGISDQIKHKNMASGLSVESQLQTLTLAVAAPVTGYIADRMGVGNALIIMGLVMAGTLFVTYIRKKG